MARRLGKFRMTREFIDDRAELAQEILGSTIIVRADMTYATDAIEYHAICDAFDEVEPHDDPPWYDAQITVKVADTLHGTTETTFKWVRQ